MRRQVVLPEPEGPSSVKNSSLLDVEIDAVDRDDVAVESCERPAEPDRDPSAVDRLPGHRGFVHPGAVGA